jgi:hypothetical protein
MLYERPQTHPEHFGCETGTLTAYHLLAEYICHLSKSVVECDEEVDAVGERFTFNGNSLVKSFKIFGHKQERIDIDRLGDKQSQILQGYSVLIC